MASTSRVLVLLLLGCPHGAVAREEAEQMRSLSSVSCTGNCTPNDEVVTDEQCGDSRIVVVAGQLEQFKATCAPPTLNSTDGCSLTMPILPSYGPSALLSTTLVGFGNTNWSVRYKLRAVDNMIGDDKVSETFDVSWTFVCPAKSTTNQKAIRATYNLRIVAMASTPRSKAWEAPQSPLKLDCLVVNEQRALIIEFANQSVSSRPLQSWPDDTFRPVFAPPALHSRPVLDEPLVRSIVAEGSGKLVLTMYASSSRSEAQTVCIYPGDGYNYYGKICTTPFAVVSDASECSTPTTTSRFLSSSPRASWTAIPLLLMIVVSAAVH